MIRLNINQFVVVILSAILFYNAYLVIDNLNRNYKIKQFVKIHNNHPIDKLIDITASLDEFYRVNGQYPQNGSFDGVKSCWGQSKSDWILDLVPEYLSKLPDIDFPSAPCNKQILYRSNNRGYKLIVHDPDDFDIVKRDLPFLIDPERETFAYGFWSELGIDF